MGYMRNHSSFVEDLVEFGLVPPWPEIIVSIVVAMIFAVMKSRRQAGSMLKNHSSSTNPAKVQAALSKSILAEMNLGKFKTVVRIWRATKASVATPITTLQQVCEALVATEPEVIVQEIIEHMVKFPAELCHERAAVAVLSRIGREGPTELMFECFTTMQQQMGLKATPKLYQVLIASYALAGKEADLARVIASTKSDLLEVPSQLYAAAIKGLLRAGKRDACLFYMEEMQRSGFSVPPSTITELFDKVTNIGDLEQLLETVTKSSLKLTPEAVTIVFDHCTNTKCHKLAHHVEECIRTTKVPFTLRMYDRFLQVYTSACDNHALKLFEELQQSSLPISEGFCIRLLIRCAESRFLTFADKVVEFARVHLQMTITLYSALMKFYGQCGMYNAACDLYPEMLRAGVEPDQVMYSCFMKFAVECDRTALLQELSRKVPIIDLQNSMSLIRAATKDKDVQGAVAVLEKLKSVGVTPDVTAYNAVLNVCAMARDLESTKKILSEMNMVVDMDLTSYNIAIEAYGACKDADGACRMLKQMEDAGIAPNEVSFNCLINMRISEGKLDEAWETVDQMLQRGMAADRYTLATMMKAAKGDQSGRDLARALNLLDQSGLDVCLDEVLLNSVLEVCIRHRFHERLKRVLDAYSNCTMSPAAHTYAALIRTCGVLRLVGRAWMLWRELVATSGVEPTQLALGCMLEALVSNDLTLQAADLFEEWKAKIPPNPVMYATLLKGFADQRPARAMDTLQQMRQSQMPLSAKVYNIVVNGFARSGRTGDIAQVLQMMEADGFSPDNFTRSLIVKGHCVAGDFDKAFQEYDKLRHAQDANMDTFLFNNLLDGCVKHNRMSLADKLMKQMEDTKMKPCPVTLAIVIKLYEKRKSLDQAFAVMKSWPQKYGFKVDGPVYSSLLSACLKSNATAQALDVFKTLRAHGHWAHTRLYGSLICSCIREGLVTEAVKVAGEAYGLNPKQTAPGMPAGQTLGTQVCDQLLRAIEENHLQSEAGNHLLIYLAKTCCDTDSCTGADRH